MSLSHRHMAVALVGRTAKTIGPARVVPWLCAAAVALGAAGVRAQSPPARLRGVEQGGSVLQPGDVVQLRIWREPDLSGDFHVDETGQAIFPKLGPVRVASMSSDSLKRLLVKSYEAYLRNPSIEVVLRRRVNVLGAVRNPGLYPVDPTMTIADVLALAGGATAEGKKDKVQLMRVGSPRPVDVSSRARIADTPIRSGDQLYVPERSWISRNAGIVGAVISATTTIVVALLLRGD